MITDTPLLVPLLLFSIVCSFTPGPNNTMLMTSGLNFGLRRTTPHVLGVAFGFGFQALCIGLGLGAVFTAFPLAYTILKYAGAAYLLYLAWCIARSDPTVPGGKVRNKPFTFLQAAAFQWVNPKAWIILVGAMSTYAAISPYPENVMFISFVFLIVGLASTMTWASFGLALQRFLKHPRHVRIFNVIMALLLVASIFPVLME